VSEYNRKKELAKILKAQIKERRLQKIAEYSD